MACTLSASGLLPLKQQQHAVRRRHSSNSACVKASSQTKQFIAQKSEQLSKSVAAATTSALSFAAAPHEAFASANESISDVALANVNILGVIAVALFIIIPVSFLVILYVKSTAEGNVSGGFSQSYYDESKKMGKKLTNEAAVLKGKGTGMRPQK